LYIAFTVLAMLNVITGIFVESALTAARASKDMEVQIQMRRLFLRIEDAGMICWTDFSDMLTEPDMLRCFKLLDIDPSEASGLFRLLDTERSGEIDAEEFVMGCLRLQGSAKAIDLATLTYFNKRMATWWHTQMVEVKETLAAILEECTSHGKSVTVPAHDADKRLSTLGVKSALLRRKSFNAGNMMGGPGSRRQSISSNNGPPERSESLASEAAADSLAAFATWSGLKNDPNEPRKAPASDRRVKRCQTAPMNTRALADDSDDSQ
jgi:hypothetical protein